MTTAHNNDPEYVMHSKGRDVYLWRNGVLIARRDGAQWITLSPGIVVRDADDDGFDVELIQSRTSCFLSGARSSAQPLRGIPRKRRACGAPRPRYHARF